MVSLIRKMTGTVGALALAAGLGAATATPAQAAPTDCPYPYVCFYASGSKTGQYQDVTSYYQSVNSASRNANTLYNTRNDDVAYVLYSNGSSKCVWPKSHMDISNYPHQVTGIKISWSATC
ncbi:hypothetical protein ACX6XY_18560 [Streptomyces sp. O3]